MTKIYEARLQPHHNGGGYYGIAGGGERILCENGEDPVTSIEEWESLAEDSVDGLQRTTELDGMIYEQNGGLVYTDAEHEQFYIVWIEE